MQNHVEITFLHEFDVSCAFRLCEGVSVMCKGLPVMHKGLHVVQRVCLYVHHDCNHDSCPIAVMS